MIIYTLRTWWRACLGRLFHRKRSASVSSSRSHCSRYILMLIWATLLCCSSFLLSWSPTSGIRAHAQDITDTPTPTNEPLFVPATPIPELGNECNGIPAGYLTITPNLEWSIRCGKCLPTATPAPGSIFFTTPTLQTSPTATEIRPNNYVIFDMTAGETCIQGARKRQGVLPWGGVSHNYVACDLSTGAPVAGATIYETFEGVGNVTIGNYTRYVQPCMYYGYGALNIKCMTETTTVLHNTSGIVYWSIEKSFNSNASFRTSHYANGLGANDGPHSGSFFFTFSVDPIALTTPEPTPNPNGSFCDAMSGTDANGDTGGGGTGDLPLITIGWGRCVTLGPITVDLTWVPGRSLLGFPESFGWPGVEICFRPVYFGELNIFGMAVKLDVIAGAMSGIWMARRMFA